MKISIFIMILIGTLPATGCGTRIRALSALESLSTDFSSTSHHYTIQTLSIDQSTWLPQFKVDGLSPGDQVVLYRDADNNCQNGAVVGSQVSTGTVVTIDSLNQRPETYPSSFRALVTSSGQSTCTDVANYSYNLLTSVVEIGAFYDEGACARLSSGEVKCWGENWAGTLGNGTVVNSAVPVSTGILNATQISTRAETACALLADGTVKCWGWNSRGQIGDGTTTMRKTPTLVGGIANAVRVARGTSHSCAIISGGTVFCWGRGTEGELGQGVFANSLVPVQVSGVNDAAELALGDRHSCAIRTGGAVYCWGNNTSQELGDGSGVNKNVPVLSSITSGAITINSHYGSTCATFSNNTASCFGGNFDGEFGNGTAGTPSATAVALPFTQISSVSQWGDGGGLVKLNGDVYRQGGGYSYGLGNNDYKDQTFYVKVSDLGPVGSMSGGYDFGCVLLMTGVVRCFGYDNGGRWSLGDNHYTNASDSSDMAPEASLPEPLQISGSIIQGSGKADAGCVLDVAKTAYCWGYNNYGQLGTGSSTTIDSSIAAIRAPLLDGADQIATNGYAACGRFGGVIKCLGQGTSGQLGNGANLSSVTLVNVTGISDAIDLKSAGGGTFCIRTTAGNISCWGSNFGGVLGDGTTTSRNAPVTVALGQPATSFTMGANHVCALLTDQTLKCWGYNFRGQLGNGNTTDQLTPVTVPGMTGITAISAGNYVSCAKKNDGKWYCWGDNLDGLLLDGTTTSRSSPVYLTGLDNALDVLAFNQSMCAILSNRTVECWGTNSHGDLGDGTFTNATTPVPLPYVTDATQLFGDYSSCALQSTGVAVCWGRQNSKGVPNFKSVVHAN